MSWLDTNARTIDDLLALVPPLRADYRVFAHRLANAVDPALLALCRRRIAQLHGLGSREPAVTGETPVERAAIDLAEQFVLDAHGISDAMMAAASAHLGPREMVALVEALAIADGMTRLQIVLEVEP